MSDVSRPCQRAHSGLELVLSEFTLCSNFASDVTTCVYDAMVRENGGGSERETRGAGGAVVVATRMMGARRTAFNEHKSVISFRIRSARGGTRQDDDDDDDRTGEA